MTNLIKRYLPLRVRLPSETDTSTDDETFLYVKQHIATGSTDSSSSRTFFVANAPFYPNVRTNILLKSLFERFGDVEEVTVTHDSRKKIGGHATSDTMEYMTTSLFKKEINSMGNSNKKHDGLTIGENLWYDQGRFAHVTFTSAKVMKKVWNALNGKKKKNNKDSEVIKFGRLEIQELQDVSLNLFQKEKKSFLNSFSENDDHDVSSDDNDDEKEQHPQQTRGFAKVVQDHRERIPSREALKKICDQIMTKYEAAEDEARKKQEESKDQPDEDGFITVSYSSGVGDVVNMEENGTIGSAGPGVNKRRREAMKRNRSSKNSVVKGSDELQDFYRFQLKETRKRGLADLKDRFQEDLKRVKKMKEDKLYRPF